MTTQRVGLRSRLRSSRSRNEVETRSVLVENGVDGNEVSRNEVAKLERSRRNEVGTRGTSSTLGLRAVADQHNNAAARPAVNVRGNSRDPKRGEWCTAKSVAIALGRFELDPFSNLRSHIIADAACALERGDDGFGDGSPGSFYTVTGGLQRASSTTRTFIQPPYSIVLRALRHYMHSRWTALLRFDPRPEWFDMVYDASELVCVLRDVVPGKRGVEFEPPPGLPKKNGGNSFPHAVYYRRAEDATPEILAMSIAWKKRPR